MLYLFRKFNGEIIAVDKHTAWDLYTSNGNWKFRPPYLGAVTELAYRDMREMVKEEVPIPYELIEAVNSGGNHPQEERELTRLQAERSKLTKEMLAMLAQGADRSVIPESMSIINKGKLSAKELKVAEKLVANMGLNE